MKIAVDNQEIHSRGLGEKHTYKVAQNAKIMNMLANTLYSDKVHAPVRELSTNALDGHIRGNTQDKPFDVYLPTRVNPSFRIRDYGCGMNREKLTELYTTYGDSDKTESNLFNGCMGIGSKSPFAYADSFTTTSYKDGKKYVCVNSKDENGIPSLQFIVDGEDTDEPNGLDISFAVKIDDFDKFQTAANTIYRHFPVKPNVVNGKLEIKPREYLYQGNGWRIYKDSEKSVAIMGWIAYPIEVRHFSNNNDDNHNYWRRYDDTPEAQILNLGVEIDFEIGDVEMDIARESLQYTKRSINAIKDKLAEVLDFLKVEMSKSFDDCESLWEARLRYNDYTRGKMRRLEKLVSIQTPKYDGIDLSKKIELNNRGYHVIHFIGEGFKKPKRYDSVHSLPSYTTEDFKKVAFYENDVERGAYAGCERVIMGDNDINEIYLVKFDDNKAKQEFIDLIGWNDDSIFEMASSCPKAEKTGKRSPRENVFKYALDKASTSRSSTRFARDWWAKEEVEFDDGGVFVEINSFKCRKADGTVFTSADVGRMIKLLETCGVTEPEELIGVKTSVVKRYRKSDDWEDVFDWIKRQFDAYLKANDVGETVANIREFRNFRNKDKYDAIFDKSRVDVDLKDSPLKVFYDKVLELEDITEKKGVACSSANCLAELLNYKLEGQAKYNLESEEELINKRYEILEILDEWDINRENNPGVVARYVSIVDSCKGD